jgi:NAD(P)-dependent dehydrogenase (short-subunit alcohol dehydrogenase family)
MPAKYILVTGCDSGFGSVVVKMLADKGFGVFATHFLKDSEKALRDKSSSIEPIQVDITKQDKVNEMAEKVKAHLASQKAELYGLVNNAGLLLQTGPVEWTPAENFEKMFAVNVVGAHRVTTSLLPLLRKSQGRIVNVASIAGRIGLPSQAAYCASKHAMEGYSDTLRRELIDWGVNVIIIEPGVFKNTNLYSTFKEGVENLWKGLEKSIQVDYGEKYKEEFAKRCNQGLNQYGSPDNSLVPKAMVKALTSPRPQYRYHVGPDANFLVPFFKYFSEVVQDAVFAFEGPILADAMDPKAGKRALARFHRPKFFRKVAILVVAFMLIRKIRRM